MENKISYAVFWKTKDNEDFDIAAGWFTNYNHAIEDFNMCLKNPRCDAVQLVECTEHFEIIEHKIKEND
jgi:hypothetical protein